MFAQLRTAQAAKDRIVTPEAVIAAAPDVILASWCGKKVVPTRIAARTGWAAIPAVRDGRIVEIWHVEDIAGLMAQIGGTLSDSVA